MSAINPGKTSQAGPAPSSLFYSPSDPTQTRKLTFSAILLEFGLKSLQGARGAFQSQFDRAQEMVKCMEELNKVMQLANGIKANFSNDAKGDTTEPYTDDNGNLKVFVDDFNRKYPNVKISASFGSGNITKANLEALISNAQTAQSTLSSQNEQQSMRTNQAMNRSSGYLQQLQAMLQAAKEGIQAAAKAGGS